MSPRELALAEEMARRELRAGAAPERQNVFISFASEDLDEVNLLRGQAKNENSEIDFNDWSLKEPFDSDRAEYVKRGIRERIRQCSVTVVYVSESTAGSRWVDWEIRESIRLGKGVVAMHKGTAPPRHLPSAIADHGIAVVPWAHEELGRAIKRAAR